MSDVKGVREMKIDHKYLHKEKLLIQRFSGLFSLEYYQKNSNRLYQEYRLNEIKKVIIDFRDFKVSISEDDLPENFEDQLEKVIKFRHQFSEKITENKDIKLVIWVDRPLPTVIAHLFVDRISNNKYEYCTTREKVIHLLGLDPEIDLSV